MTTITLSDKALLLDGHAGNRDVCIALSALSQLVAETMGKTESKEPGRHEIAFTAYGAVVYVEMLDAFADIVGEISVMYPDNVRFSDERR